MQKKKKDWKTIISLNGIIKYEMWKTTKVLKIILQIEGLRISKLRFSLETATEALKAWPRSKMVSVIKHVGCQHQSIKVQLD